MSAPILVRLEPDTPTPAGFGSEGWRALHNALATIGVGSQRWGLVLVGGASGLDSEVAHRLSDLFVGQLAPWLGGTGGMVVDGGTAAGVMALMGAARQQSGSLFPLLGVAASGAIVDPDRSCREPDSGSECPTARLDPHHSHALLVPGECWGDEVPWLAAAASVLIPAHRCVTLVCGGGSITHCDVAESLRLRRPLVVLRGSGGTADWLAERVWRRPAGSRLVRVLDLDDAGTDLRALLAPMVDAEPEISG
jgi:hypothetical protein